MSIVNVEFKRIGPEGEADVPLLVEMRRGFYAHEGLRFGEAVACAALAGLMKDEARGFSWFIRLGKETVGYVVLTFGYSLEFQGRAAFVDELYLRASARGRGGGRWSSWSRRAGRSACARCTSKSSARTRGRRPSTASSASRTTTVT